jgi:hypothetical protein
VQSFAYVGMQLSFETMARDTSEADVISVDPSKKPAIMPAHFQQWAHYYCYFAANVLLMSTSMTRSTHMKRPVGYPSILLLTLAYPRAQWRFVVRPQLLKHI